MATSTYGTPYVQGSDLVSAYPTVSSSLATRVDEVSYRGNGLNAQTGTTYTLVVGDAGKTITLSNASPVAVSLPQDSTADLPDGAVVTFYNLGAGTVTISQGTGATLQGGSITLAQYEVTTVIKLSANTYGRFDGAPAAGLSAATPTSIANSGGTATLSGNTVTFTGVTSVSLNDCFSATYDNYRIMLNCDANSTTNGIYLRMRVAGADNSSSNYFYNGLTLNTSSATAFSSNRSAGATTQWAVMDTDNTEVGVAPIDIMNPFKSLNTGILCMFVNQNATDIRIGSVHGLMSVTTSYTSFSLIASTGTITGTVAAYGFRK